MQLAGPGTVVGGMMRHHARLLPPRPPQHARHTQPALASSHLLRTHICRAQPPASGEPEKQQQAVGEAAELPPLQTAGASSDSASQPAASSGRGVAEAGAPVAPSTIDTMESISRLTGSSSGSGSPASDAATSSSASGSADGAPSPSGQQPDAQPQAGLLHQLAVPFAAVAAALAALKAQLARLPAWAHAQRLKKLKQQAEEEPQNAERQALYLAALNVKHPAKVLARVEGRKYASNQAVVVEYLRALVSTGRLQAYANAPAGPAAGEDHRSLSQLLRELQSQAESEAADESPGASIRRPLHVTVSAPGAAALSARPAGLWQVLWTIVSTGLMLVVLAFAWLVGSQAVRRVQAQQSAAAASGISTSAAGALGGSPAVDPKEYKKDELPEKSVKTFKDVLGCEESKAELQVGGG